MSKKDIVLPYLEKLLSTQIAKTLPPYIQLAQKMPSRTDETRQIMKNGISEIHQTEYYDFYILNKPISKIFDPKTFHTDND